MSRPQTHRLPAAPPRDPRRSQCSNWVLWSGRLLWSHGLPDKTRSCLIHFRAYLDPHIQDIDIAYPVKLEVRLVAFVDNVSILPVENDIIVGVASRPDRLERLFDFALNERPQ